MNHEDLLKKYIERVRDCNDGWDCTGRDRPDGWTVEEWDELCRVAGHNSEFVPSPPLTVEQIAAETQRLLKVEEEQFKERLAFGRARYEAYLAVPWWRKVWAKFRGNRLQF